MFSVSFEVIDYDLIRSICSQNLAETSDY